MKIPVLEYFFNKANYQNKTPTQGFSCEHSEIFKNTCFEEHLQTAAFIIPNFRFIVTVFQILKSEVQLCTFLNITLPVKT